MAGRHGLPLRRSASSCSWAPAAVTNAERCLAQGDHLQGKVFEQSRTMAPRERTAVARPITVLDDLGLEQWGREQVRWNPPAWFRFPATGSHLVDKSKTARITWRSGAASEGDGSFVFETRLGDVLRLGGYLVAPAEIEDYVRRFPGIAACEAVGAVGEGGLVAVAFVTLSPGAALDEAALRRSCAAGLARFKVPARCVALDAFPTTASANGTKVQRARLREMAERLLAGAAT
jgi:acyl-CoA synthetase (AMP-forming)/AMP-acid ligase II